ncbi:zinc ribbon domain-containing protein [Dapis sp. BLCC M126]|uniref:zinc ribbon domain-containing protein n=1 Tax=Dapis sp. BLCC M126 TaxID=3400189 RepID=UPI003CF48F56
MPFSQLKKIILKTYSSCAHVIDMPLSMRSFDCPECGIFISRDLKASINLTDTVGQYQLMVVEFLLPTLTVKAGSKH